MSDPNWSDAVRDEIHQDQGYGLGLGGLAYALEQLFHPQASECLFTCTDETVRAKLTNVRITACESDVDTDEDGFVYLLFADETPGAGQGRIRFYRGATRDGSAGNELVAQASGNDGTTITITPESGYTLAGSMTMAALGAGDNAHEACATVEVPMAMRLQQLFDGTQAYDQQIKEQGVVTQREMRAGFAAARQAAERFAAFVTNVEVVPTLVARTGTGLINPGVSVSLGVVSVAPTGTLRDQELAQAANTGGAGAVKAAAGAWSGSVSFPGWQGTASGLTYGQRAQAASLTFTAVKKMNNAGQNSAPEFAVRRVLGDRRRRPDEGRTDAELLGRRLRVGALFRAPEWGIEALTIDFKASVTNVTSALLSTTAGDWSVVGLTSENSTSGQVFPRYDGTTLTFYKSSAGRTAEDADDVVASVALASSAVNTTFQAVGATLTINGKTGAGSTGALVTGSVGDVDFQAPALGAYFTLAISETTEPSEWVKRLRDGGVGGASWKPNTGSGPNLPDGMITRGLPLINAGVQGARY